MLHNTTLLQHLHNITLLYSDVEDQTMLQPHNILRIVISHKTEGLIPLLRNNRAEEEKLNTITTQEYNGETPKPEKKPRPLSKPSIRELLLCTTTHSQSKYLN